MSTPRHPPTIKIKELEDQVYAQLIHIKKLEAENAVLKMKLTEKNVVHYGGEYDSAEM